MKNVAAVMQESGISYPTLVKYTEMGLLPQPQTIWRGRKGSESWYPDEVTHIINWVKLHQMRGLSLSEIAERCKERRAEIEVIEPTEEYLIAIKGDETRSVLDDYDSLYPWIEKQIEQQAFGYELASIEVERVIRQGKEFLKPKRIQVKLVCGLSAIMGHA